MTAGDFKPVFTTTNSPVEERPPPVLQASFKDSFKLPTLLALGALVQTAVIAVLPARYSLFPLLLLLGRAIISTILQVRSPKDSHFTLDVVPGRMSAQLPSRTTGAFGTKPAAKPLVVFHIGVRFNHPLGLLSPGAKEIAGYFAAMVKELEQRRDEFGMLTITNWRGTERSTNNTLMNVAYFRDVDGLNRFAHDKVHRDAWDWYLRFAKKEGNSHIGIFHETFVTRPGDYETIYVDCQPTLLGAANVQVNADDSEKVKTEEKETWIRPLVSANHSSLRSQQGRMGTRLPFEGDADMY
ncbi:hypothetical protein KVR01_006151 [Diaporthe batatas]|uniref:uncharacterized protein n=1 Tax=Diaporthe batatas TaxID=748121 RepID=UPI001D041B29|nr:uncharacterized protein KVR01_006151 [Diaporthe batatas]KAG8164233.1 hypothetical protein KVR01_006151 [Diaporthe batatas]